MNIRKSLMVLAFAASCALASLPSTMLFQGHMPGVSGTKSVRVDLYDAATDGTVEHSQIFTDVSFQDGFFAVELSSLPAFDKPLFVQLSIGAETSATRIPLTLAPYAKRSAVADSSVKAAYATSAGIADNATNAATAALATQATNADYATSAGSAKTAEKADVATSATNATHATTANAANNASVALTAVTADKAKALDASVNTLNLHGGPYGEAIISVDTTVGVTTYNSFIGLDPKNNTVRFSISAAGASSGSGAGMVFSRDGLDIGGTGIKLSEYNSLVSGSTACSVDMRRMVVFTNSGTATRGLYVCDDNGSGSYYWYKL